MLMMHFCSQNSLIKAITWTEPEFKQYIVLSIEN
jgi:hypothetical protein